MKKKYGWFHAINPFAKQELARRYDEIIHKQKAINVLAKQQEYILAESEIAIGYNAAQSIRKRIEKLSEVEE